MKGVIVKLILTLVSGGVGFYVVTTLLNGLDMSGYPASASAMASVLPVVYVAIVIVGIVKSIGVDSTEEQIDWTRYGERLKLAYTAKFGGENPGFNSEVDYRIKIMVNTDGGYTRQIAKDWVKRMSKFTELKWLKMDDANDEE